jgi:hypothetical protein
MYAVPHAFFADALEAVLWAVVVALGLGAVAITVTAIPQRRRLARAARQFADAAARGALDGADLAAASILRRNDRSA